MTIKKRSQNIDFDSNQKRYSKLPIGKKSMRFAKCICGFKILLVPDVRAMDRAIKNHVAKHQKANIASRKFELDKLTEFLTEQVLIAASK